MSDEPLKILIADDTPGNLEQLEVVVRRLGHIPILAEDGEAALELYQQTHPDLVIMDIVMPRLSGIDAVRAIRALPGDGGWTPILFYSALDRMSDIVEGFAAGADDYLVKPAPLELIRVKIDSYARTLALQGRVRHYVDELASWRAAAEEQNRLGNHVMARLTDAEGLRDPMLNHFNLPADTFSGDLLCAARAPGDVLNVMLADAAGHGLAAALSAMPLTQAFYSMTAKGFPLSSIAEELNRKLKKILPADRFVAATLASVDVRNQTVEIWNGGNPDALFLNSAGQVCMQWASMHPPLGILPEGLFSNVTDTVVFHEPGDLVLCSDGLIEAENPQGTGLGLQGVIGLLQQEREREQRFLHLRSGVERHLAAEHGRDDISCMLIGVPIERRNLARVPAPVPRYQGNVADWRLQLAYGANELRYVDVVPAALGMLTQIEAIKPHQGALFLIISELFNNALDHGLLGLDSRTKAWIGGFEIYLQQRVEALAKLEQGRIELSFHLHAQDQQAMLDIELVDSGAGFDYTLLDAQAALAEENKPHGRGIALVRGMCSELVYTGKGNRVRARLLL